MAEYLQHAHTRVYTCSLLLLNCLGWLQMAPETFRRLAQGEAAMRKAMGGNLQALQCTHPRSEVRVQMLEEELAMMNENSDIALQKVMHKVPYWML